MLVLICLTVSSFSTTQYLERLYDDDEMCFISPSQRLYKEKGVNDQHNYTITSERPEITQAKINAANFSEVLWVPVTWALYYIL